MDSASLPPLAAIVGPTAAGKTALAVELAAHIDIEVVSADSRQIYRRLDIGTSKPTEEERRRLEHHLVDIVDPQATLTLAEYQQMAFRAIEEIWSRGRLPVLVGGSGLYVWSVLENRHIPAIAPQPGTRERLEREAECEGAEALHRRLAGIDPEAARGIHPKNVRRVIRALEVYELTGRPISQQRRKGAPRYQTLVLGLTAPRDRLYARCDKRVDAMVAQGLLEETRELLQSGLTLDLPSMSGLGYRQMGAHLAGLCDRDEAIRRTKTGTHRLIRQQYTWFRLDDPRIHWFEQPADMVAILALLRGLVERAG